MFVPLEAVFAPNSAVAALPAGALPVLQFDPVSQAPLALGFQVCAHDPGLGSNPARTMTNTTHADCSGHARDFLNVAPRHPPPRAADG